MLYRKYIARGGGGGGGGGGAAAAVSTCSNAMISTVVASHTAPWLRTTVTCSAGRAAGAALSASAGAQAHWLYLPPPA